MIQITERNIQHKEHELDSPCLLFGWLPADIIKYIFLNSTQYDIMPMGAIIKNKYISPFAEMNVYLHDKPVETDTSYYETPSIDYVSTCY